MDIFMPMSTTTRHNRLINTFIGDILNLSRKKEVYALQSDCALVYYGQRKEPQSVKLVNISKLTDVEKFVNSEIEHLEYVQPDVMIFKNNPYLENRSELRVAGQPDLIIEVWSKSNTMEDREFKKFLYSASDITEHWYIEQDSNSVQSYMGAVQLPVQCLTGILRTQKGLEFDLRYLAIGNQ
jgi:Uma2 family endonuclease